MYNLNGIALSLLKEVYYQTARSGGKGGQHVNKVETKVELYFDIPNSAILDTEQKQILSAHLGSKLSNDGILKLISQAGRSQFDNKSKVQQKFVQLIVYALTPQKMRTATKIPKKSVAQRLLNKKLIGQKKQNRKGNFNTDTD